MFVLVLVRAAAGLWLVSWAVGGHGTSVDTLSLHALLNSSHLNHSIHSPAVSRPGKPQRRDHFLCLEATENNRLTGNTPALSNPTLGGPCQSSSLILRSRTSVTLQLPLSFFWLEEWTVAGDRGAGPVGS